MDIHVSLHELLVDKTQKYKTIRVNRKDRKKYCEKELERLGIGQKLDKKSTKYQRLLGNIQHTVTHISDMQQMIIL